MSAARRGGHELQTDYDYESTMQGEPCDCYVDLWWKQTCCGKGLVCGRESNTCEKALGSECKSKWVGSQCAGDDVYHVNTKCGPADSDGKSVCCIKSYQFLKNPGPKDETLCCSGKSEEVEIATARRGEETKKMSRLNETHPKKHLYLNQPSPGQGFAAAAIQDAVSRSAGVSMAVDVVGSFEAMRRYLREVKKCLERVDPHLCNNVGLVARLVDWEESWEIGARYVRQRSLFEANNDIVAEFRIAQNLAPAFTTMCTLNLRCVFLFCILGGTDCDVELFLVLPRMVILCCLEKPLEPRAGLLRSLLPHRFPENANSGLEQDPEMGALITQFNQVVQLLSGDWDSAPHATLVRRAVAGTADEVRHLPRAVQERVEHLMRDVEKWSLELQRKNAEDWNQCSSVLVQCMNGSSQKQHLLPSGKFQV
eukprot:symbB.v1.2.037001.t1/scaffold5352.1/size28163/2